MTESGLLDDVDVEAPLLWDLDDNVGADAAAGRKCAVAPGVDMGMGQKLLPSGKLTVCYGKSPFLMRKFTINGHFQ